MATTAPLPTELPKSFADAVVDGKDRTAGSNGNGKHEAHHSQSFADTVVDGHNSNGKHSTHHDENHPKTYADAIVEGPSTYIGKENRAGTPELSRKESSHEYTAEGLDDAPRTPEKHKIRKVLSRKSNASMKSHEGSTEDKVLQASPKSKATVGISKVNGEATGRAESPKANDKPKAKVEDKKANGNSDGKVDKKMNNKPQTQIEDTKPIDQSEKKVEDHKSNGESKAVSKGENEKKKNTKVEDNEGDIKSNPKVKDKNPNTTVEEGHTNGKKLVSIKPSPDYEMQLEMDRKQRPLASGRQAGQRWEKSAIRFAPMNVPLQRRLQTLIVLGHTLCIALPVAVFFGLCAIPLFWPLLIPYMLYCMFSTAHTSGTLSHRSDFLRGLPIWSLFAGYFPARLHRTQELPPTRKYIFGYHPHGIISHGAYAAFATEALGFSQLFPGIKNTLLTLDTNFRIPLYRDYALAMGLASVSGESCKNLLSKGGPNGEGMGRAITIVVGGAQEALDAQPDSLRLVLNCRKGFIKMAIRTGADLVPVLSFGENDIYDQIQADDHAWIHWFQMKVKKYLGFTTPLFHARGVFNYDVGMMPYRRPMNIVVGAPILVVKEAEPSQESIDRLHKEYVTELQRLWDLWKDEFAPHRKEEMTIVA